MGRPFSFALVGSESLIGREIRDLFGEHLSPAELKLVADEGEEPGRLTEISGEPAVVGRLDAESLGDAAVVFLAGTPESSRQAVRAARSLHKPPVLIDLTYACEDDPEARIRAPRLAKTPVAASSLNVIAHPAAIAIAMFLQRVHPVHKIRRSLIHIFEPASERGAAGLEELQQQTVNLLSFKQLPKKIFDAQVSFNMLASYGEEAPVALRHVELRIERHLASLLSHQGLPMPSLRLIQAPVFHGHSYSLWVEFESNPGAERLEDTLAVANIDVRRADLEPPNAVGIAGQSGIAIGGVSADRNEPRACWLWMVADNLRLAAENAVALAGEILQTGHPH